MLNEVQRKLLLVGVLMVCLIGVNIWCYNQYAESKRQADAVAEDIEKVAKIADQIERLRQQPTFTNEELPDLKINQLIYEATEKSGLDPDKTISSIVPQTARRITGTAYKQKDTHLKIDNVKMADLLLFLHQLVYDNPGLKVKSIQLSPPNDDIGTNWDVEPLVISYLIYAP